MVETGVQQVLVGQRHFLHFPAEHSVLAPFSLTPAHFSHVSYTLGTRHLQNHTKGYKVYTDLVKNVNLALENIRNILEKLLYVNHELHNFMFACCDWWWGKHLRGRDSM